ncbi:MAG TPA: NYN domain-containing protein [Candidatus Paceibacterota bacterium]|nr:NYN domain-containing protein [Candidatus Paceibacterota bacterium]HMP19221.1 NYN domain-containing protein [Candidatus Paceibacterota bacterium]
MLNSKKTSRVGIFIDEANIYHSQKTVKWEVDYLRLRRFFTKFGRITVLNFYTSFQYENEKQNNFLMKIGQYGYHVFRKKLKIIRKNNLYIKKGNLDIELALDAYKLKNLYDIFILFSGDSDFEYLLKLLKDENKMIFVVSTRKHISKELFKTANKYFDLNKIRYEISMIKEDQPIGWSS